MTPRQSDMNLESLVAKFHEKQIQLEETAFRERFPVKIKNNIKRSCTLQDVVVVFRFNEEQRREEDLQRKRLESITKYKNVVAKRSEMLARIQ